MPTDPDDLVLQPKGPPGSGSPGGPEVHAAVVIVAAGNSTRMAGVGAARKPKLELNGKPLLEHTCALFNAIPEVHEIVLVAHPDDVTVFEQWTLDKPALDKVRAIVPGGKERADSVRLGVFWCGFDMDVILVHDAARPLVRPAVVREAIATAFRTGAALVAAPVHDTIKELAPGPKETPRAARTLDRSQLFAAQTPQAFRAEDLRDLVADAAEEDLRLTDDAALWERARGPVPIVLSDASNLKITTPIDLEIAAAILRSREEREDTP
jgi:2-C-methyl-D-erythritol 4-phosphate cytidylyltransferase